MMIDSRREGAASAIACARVATVCLLLALTAAAAEGQQFVRFESATDDRDVSVRAAGRLVSVDLALVRSGPMRLELPTPDGRLLVAERSVFEDRGDGNVMWSGGVPGAGYDGVVLTVQDGYLQGRFGEPSGTAYWIHAGSDGSGRLLQPVEDGPDVLCPGGIPSDSRPGAAVAAAQRADPPHGIVSASNHDQLDILALYSVLAEDNWRDADMGTPRAMIQLALDYTNLAFRNNALPFTVRLVHMAEAPAALDGRSGVLQRLTANKQVAELRARYNADLVHFFTGESPNVLGFCGQAWFPIFGDTAESFSEMGYGVSTSICNVRDQSGDFPYVSRVFAHEVGHNLGAQHDPMNARSNAKDFVIKPWAFGHSDIQRVPSIETIMSYRSRGPRRWEPFFSTVRISPNDWTLGIELERENERAFQETLPMAVQYSDFMPDPADFDPPEDLPEAPGKLKVTSTSETSARLEWVDRSETERGFHVQARSGGGSWTILQTEAEDSETANVTGLTSRGRYTFRVRAFHNQGAADSDAVTITLSSGGGSGPGPGPRPGDIDIPTDVAAAALGAAAVELFWQGVANGTVEIEARTWTAGWEQVATAQAATGRATVENLESEAPYTFRLRTRAGSGKRSGWSGEVSATTGDVTGACRTGGQFLCLSEGRFEVQTHWKNHLEEGDFGTATAVPIDVSDESGMFWFFNSSNIELVVKTLDGRALNGHYWVYFGALSNVEYWVTVRDTLDGRRRTYHNPPAENCGQSDTMAFVPATTSSAPASGSLKGAPGFDLLALSVASVELPGLAQGQEAEGACEAGETRLCLHDGQFSVEVELVDPNGMERKAGKVVASVGTKETGFFWFFSPTNVELAAKLLDGRELNGKYWFLYGGLSDVEYTITLTDTTTGESRPYYNPSGSLCGGIDINALPR